MKSTTDVNVGTKDKVKSPFSLEVTLWSPVGGQISAEARSISDTVTHVISSVTARIFVDGKLAKESTADNLVEVVNVIGE